MIEHRIVDASDPEAIVDQVSDLSSAKESVCFLSLLFLQNDLLLEVGICDSYSRIMQFLRPMIQNREKG